MFSKSSILSRLSKVWMCHIGQRLTVTKVQTRQITPRNNHGFEKIPEVFGPNVCCTLRLGFFVLGLYFAGAVLFASFDLSIVFVFHRRYSIRTSVRYAWALCACVCVCTIRSDLFHSVIEQFSPLHRPCHWNRKRLIPRCTLKFCRSCACSRTRTYGTPVAVSTSVMI
jgi:hypothetical protein